MLSNNDSPIRVDYYDRRYCVMATEKLQSVQYYDALYNEIDQYEFYPALLYYLLHYDISNFNPRAKPMTEETKRLKNKSRHRIEQFIDDWRIYCYKSVSGLYYLYKEYCNIYYGGMCDIK